MSVHRVLRCLNAVVSFEQRTIEDLQAASLLSNQLQTFPTFCHIHTE